MYVQSVIHIPLFRTVWAFILLFVHPNIIAAVVVAVKNPRRKCDVRIHRSYAGGVIRGFSLRQMFMQSVTSCKIGNGHTCDIKLKYNVNLADAFFKYAICLCSRLNGNISYNYKIGS